MVVIVITAEHAKRGHGCAALEKEGKLGAGGRDPQHAVPNRKHIVHIGILGVDRTDRLLRSLRHTLCRDAQFSRDPLRGHMLQSQHIDLVGCSHRHSSQLQQMCRQHIYRQNTPQTFQDLFRIKDAAFCFIESTQLHGAITVAYCHSGSLSDQTGFQNRTGDLGQFYPLAIKLYLSVLTAQELVTAIHTLADHISATVHLLSGEVQILHEGGLS